MAFGSDPLNPASFPLIPNSGPTVASIAFSAGNQTSPAPATQTFTFAEVPFSMLNSASPVPNTPQTYAVAELSFSMLNSASPVSSTPQTYAAAGVPFSMLNAASPAAASLTSWISSLTFSLFNGLTSGSFGSEATSPRLNFLVPVDPVFLAEALARGAHTVGGKPACKDTDGDGICDADELILGTNPFLVDSDGDGYPDGLELALGSDPLDPKSIPNLRPPGYLMSPPVSVQTRISVAMLTPRRQGAIDAQ